MRSALKAHLSAESNKKALVYAPWVMSLMLVIFVRENAGTFDVEDWAKVGAFVAAMPVLGRLARGALRNQQLQAEDTIERLIKSGRGIEDLNRLQTESTTYRNVRLSDRVQTLIINSARAQEVRDQERRQRAVRDEVTGAGLSRVPALSGR